MKRLLITLLCLVAVPVVADFKADYEAGLTAADRGDWPEVARRMRNAIAERPESSGRLLALGLKRYLPHYHLGLALSETGDCRGAIASFDEELRQEAIAKAKENDILVERRGACNELISEAQVLAGKLRAPFDAAASQISELSRLARTPELKREWPTRFAEDQELAAAELRKARAEAERADQALDRTTLQGLSIRLTTLSADLDRLLAAATSRRDEVRVRAEAQLQEIDKVVNAARADLRFVAYLEPFPPALEEARQSLEGRLVEAATADVGNSEEELDELRKRVLADLSRLRREVKAPPDSLRNVAIAFFSADYERALELLESSTYQDARAAAQACLLRSATLHAVARRAGGTPKLFERVRKQVRTCLASTAVVEPPAGFFAPSFSSFFDREKAALAAEVAASAIPPADAARASDSGG